MQDEKTVDLMVRAFKKVLSEGDTPEEQRTILIKRIPIICNDILEIKTDMKWIKWLVMGGAATIGTIQIYFK